MSAKNKKSLKLIIAALVITLSSVFLPTMGAYAEMPGNGEEKAKNYLYATAAYQCAINAGEGNFENYNEFVTIGHDVSSIFTSSFRQTKVSIGKWLGDDDGKITCGDAIDKAAAALGITSISAEDMNLGGFLYQVYNLFSEPLEYLFCRYPITMDADAEDVFLNADGSDWIEFWWPQGYVDDLASEGGIKDKTTATPLFFGFGQNGQFVKLGHNSSLSLDSELNPNLAENVSTAWGNVSTGITPEQRELNQSAPNIFCKDLLSSPHIKIFSRVEQVCSTSANGPNAGQSCQNETRYGNIRFAKDVAGSDGVYPNTFWRTGVLTNNHLGNNQRKAIYDNYFTRVANAQQVLGLFGSVEQSESTGNTAEWVKENAARASQTMSTKLKRNISELLFDGNYSAGSTPTPDQYLESHPEIKYVIMGRYLFNGDNGLVRGRNCGGFSIRSDDPNYDPSNTYWNTAQSYNVTTQAYPTTTIGHKDPFITKIGGDAGLDEGDASLTAAWKPGGGEELCTSIAETFNGITLSGGNHGWALRAVFGYINPITIDGSGNVPVTPYNPANPGNVETTEVNCYTNAGALGWILCPIVESGGQFVEDIYDKFIEPQLVLDSGFFNRSNQGGEETYQAWQTFRNLANIAFVAVFLFVIFSQLTGFGIDNYGIKKILPKMVIAAIIVNASYIICQIAIDAANIIGYGIKNIMGGIGTVPSDTEFAIREGGHTLASIGSNVGIAAIVAALTVPAVLGQGVGILVTVFTALIGIVVAILTLFVVLAARKALSLVLVVISPLAFLCYMLPNTKKLFNQWLNAMKGTLLAFPICAGMVFGGQAVSRIVMLTSGESSGTFFLTLIAAATAVAPIFLIPSVLKKSMGAISAVIDRASHGVSRFGKSHWQGSQSAKRLKEAGAAYQEEREVNRAKRALYGGRFNKGLMNEKELSRRQALAVRKHARTLNAYNKGTAEAYETIMESSGLDKANEVLMGTSDVNASIAALQKVNGIDAGATVESLRNYTNSEAFRNLNSADQMKFANACRAMKDNPMAQAYGKLLAESLGKDKRAVSWNDVEGETLNNKIRGLGNDALVNASKDILTSENLSRFSAEQIKTASTAHFSGDKLSKLNSALAGMDNARQEEVLSNMVDGSDWSNIRFDTLNALGGKARVDAMRSSGDYAGMERAISGLENAQELHASTDSDVLGALGITPGAKEAQARAQSQAAAQAQADAMKAQADALNELNQHLKAQNTNRYGVGDPDRRYPPSQFNGGNA